MITIVNYGLGNIQAIANIYKRLGIPVTLAASDADLRNPRKVILPGVGAFDWAMARLEQSGMRRRLDDLIAAEACDVLGICVGMQMLARLSDEGASKGLGWVDAEVRIFEENRLTDKTRLPHMGWNDVAPRAVDSLFRGLDSGARFYFLHSYYFAPDRDCDVLALTDYGGPFASSIRRGRIFGVQFHPEKSHQWGIQLLRNFADL